MNGRKIPLESNAMKAMVAYMEWLGDDLPKELEAYYKGYAPIRLPERAVDLEAGKVVYTRECALCHGQDGMGIPGPEKGYLYPPLWGADSFNDGAGMHRVITAAEFIRGNMPFGMATRDNPKLTDEEAYDVAGYINSFERPHKNGTENDYPDLTLKPVSTSYGPWVDDFSATEHKFGPFQPIMAYYKAKFDIVKSK
jgi:thiosulfate dehydrogenase